jgi:hypothetical protein
MPEARSPLEAEDPMPTTTAVIKPRTRRSFPKPGTKLYEALTYRARRELDWYFENPNDRAKRADAAASIQSWLAVAFIEARGMGKCVAPWTKRRKPMPPEAPSGTRISATNLDAREPSPVVSV